MASAAQQTLFMPFENGILPPPAGRMRFLAAGIDADTALDDAWKKALTCLQPFRPEYLKLEKAGFDVVARLEGNARFDGGLMLLGKHRGRNEEWFAEMLSRVAPDGIIVVCGGNKLGIDGFRKWAGKIVAVEDRFSKNHAVVFWLRRPDDLPDDAIAALRPTAKHVEGQFHTAAGMFSHGAIDKGSALLAGHLEGRVSGAVADFGAGWGYLAAECLKHPKKIRKLDLYEADFESIEAARGNLPSLSGEIPLSFHWHDLVSEQVAEIYDTVVMNPPFHEGRATDVSLGQAFIAVAARRLKPGGRLLLVANRQLPYEATLKPLFRSVETLQETDGFKVIEAKK
ncbi:class I SAM-dependent methyltransferase [Phyllobacterium salinisoli]|uniref:Class I SAM-dependent methyltransferase n=1 Tax=Phyllobacterium salinisoli TaxID=1899321 RepID=A0A368K6N2_9HYPH|nr:class I SAM-dependent methyltransferase [Phyllobacterium salinisoli]RCS25037.1 class I SAM-dependent methyltransferase [Phyllobacterium salinisoli]